MQQESGLDIIISVFIRYSELSAVKYDLEKGIIKVEIALNTSLTDQQRSKFVSSYNKTLGLFYKMGKFQPVFTKLSFLENTGITILRLYRDGKTLREDEMELFVLLLRQEFASLLVRDDNDMGLGALFSSEAKRTLMQKLGGSQKNYHNIFAYRDQGRVFVFNK